MVGSRQQKVKRHVLRVLEFNVLAVRKIDAPLHAGANDRFAQFLVIFVMKLVLRELSLHFVSGCHKESRDIVPEKIDELIVGHDDQNIGLRLLEIATQRSERGLSVLAQFLLLIEGRPARRAGGRHAVVQIHEIFPLTSGFEQNIGRVTGAKR